jgi:3-hydroxy acid dehydrogenase/malonic semialdehyde reductase
MKKIALITGATSGIGEACARRFAIGGYDLILTGRNQNKLDALKKQLIEEEGIDVKLLCFDVRDRDAATAAVASLIMPDWHSVWKKNTKAILTIGQR